MKWFDQWFLKKSKKAWDAAATSVAEPSNRVYKDDSVFYNVYSGLDISVYGADGGFIIKVTKKSKTGLLSTGLPNNESQLYVISRSEDLPTKLSELITMELLRS